MISFEYLQIQEWAKKGVSSSPPTLMLVKKIKNACSAEKILKMLITFNFNMIKLLTTHDKYSAQTFHKKVATEAKNLCFYVLFCKNFFFYFPLKF